MFTTIKTSFVSHKKAVAAAFATTVAMLATLFLVRR